MEGLKMEIKTKIVNHNKYVFINDYWETSSSWGHKTVIYKNNYKIASNKVRYYNRTWETYKYQSCMNGAINIVYNDALNDFINDYKINNNILRLKQDDKEQLKKDFKKSIEGKELLKVKKAIEDNSFINKVV